MPDLGFNCRTERDKWRAGGVVESEWKCAVLRRSNYDAYGGLLGNRCMIVFVLFVQHIMCTVYSIICLSPIASTFIAKTRAEPQLG